MTIIKNWSLFVLLLGWVSSAKAIYPLQDAAMKNDIPRLRKLLGSGEDVNKADSSGKMAIEYAIDRGYAEVVKVLLEYEAQINFPHESKDLLTAAVNSNSLEIVELFLNKGAHTELRVYNQTPVMAAACNGRNNTQILMALLEHGADIRTRDKNNRSIFYCATQDNVSREILKIIKRWSIKKQILITDKADIEILDGRHPGRYQMQFERYGIHLKLLAKKIQAVQGIDGIPPVIAGIIGEYLKE